MGPGHQQLLEREKFQEIFGVLSSYRIDSFVRMLEKKKGPNVGKVLPFVRGLRFSSLLTYAIREYLNGTELTANWGHIVDNKGTYVSKEADIIIHKNGFVKQWNGNGGGDPIMNFKFILQANAVAVVSCKSFLRPNDIEIDYCNEMKKYVNKVWLFSECCGPRSPAAIKNKARQIGYDDYWHMYTWTENQGIIDPNHSGWDDFVSKVKGLV